MKRPEPLPCPICESEMEVKPYQTGEGFRYVCRGSDEEPHRVTVYVQFFQRKGSGRPRRAVAAVLMGEGVDRLLERADRLGGKE